MWFHRVYLGLSALLLLVNCSNQTAFSSNPAPKRGFLDTAGAGTRHFSRADTNDDGTIRVTSRRVREPEYPTVDVGHNSAGSVDTPGQSDLSIVAEKKATRQSDERSANGFIAVSHSVNPPQSSQDSKFLENMAKDDRENQTLKLKTIICRGC